MTTPENKEQRPPSAGRRTAVERKAALEERKRQIEAQLQALSARERAAARKRDTRRKIVVGAAVMARADFDPAFAEQLRQILREATTRPVDREVIADLLETVLSAATGSEGML